MPSARCDPTDWSRDGRWLVANVFSSKDIDVWMLSTTGESPRPPLDAEAVTGLRSTTCSPDGRIDFLDRNNDPPPSEFDVVLGWPGILK